MRPLLLLAAAALCAQAATIEARYAISFWVFGRIGTATLKLETGPGRYRIEANATLEGVAALLAHHHREYHNSVGRMDADGRLLPERYHVLRTLDNYRRDRTYRFGRGGIYRSQAETFVAVTRRFDPAAMRFVTTKHPSERRYTRLEPYRAEDDLLTLYFNARKKLETLPPGRSVILRAAGAGDGKVLVKREQAPQHYTVRLEQDIFRSAHGEMQIETDKDFYVKKAVLKDVLLFGDLEVKREWLRLSP